MTTRFYYKTLVLLTANNLLAYIKPKIVHSGKLLFILITLLHFAWTSQGQERITISGRQLRIEQVLKKIEAQTGYMAWMEDGLLDKAPRIDVDVHNLTLEQALEVIFRNLPLSYKVIGHTIVINRRKVVPVLREIRGTVFSEGQPLESASVQIKGSRKGVITGPNGEFFLVRNPSDTILIISSVGYETLEISISEMPVLRIELSKSVQELDEPVVIAYGTTSKRINPGSVGTLNSLQVGIQPVTNPLLALQGRIPGLFIQQTTGVTDGEVKVHLGGQNSISGGNEPFYIVDGVPFPTSSLIQTGGGIILYGSPLTYLNPQDIESISVLKDADATSIYGSRGANGVILITTKKGHRGKPQITFSSAVGTGKVASKMKLLSTPEYLVMRREAFKNDQAEPDPTIDYDLLTWDTLRNVDWRKALIGHTGRIHQQRLSVSGGTQRTSFQSSVTYRRETTVFPGDFFNDKGFFHTNVRSTSANRNLIAVFSIIGAIDRKVLPISDPTFAALTLPPNTPSGYNTDGSFNWTPGYNNPYPILCQLYKARGSNLITNANITYNPWKGFKVKANFGLTSTILQEITPIPVTTLDPAYGITTSSSTFAHNNVFSWIAEPQLEYTRYLGRGKISLLSGVTFQHIQTNSKLISATGYTDPSLLEALDGAAALSVVNQGFSQYRYVGAYARIKYELKNSYIAEFTGRRDGSSRFGPDRQFGTFGAFGIAWLISEETWFKKKWLKVANFAKLKVSYGVLGNDQIFDYEYLPTWRPTTTFYGSRAALVPVRLYNGEYGWESNHKLNMGIETAFWNNRIQLAMSYYRARSSNQLVSYPLSGVTGFQSVQGNLGAVVLNRALEFEINTLNVSSNVFKWITSFNLTIPKNVLKAFPKLEASKYRNEYVIGKNLNVLKAFHFTGIDKNTGLYIFEDVDKDGRISFPNDFTAYKSVNQQFYGGMLNKISYKGLDIDIFIQFVKQSGFNYISPYYVYSSIWAPAPGMSVNQPNYVLNRWQEVGMEAGIQQFTQRLGSAAYNAFNNFTQSDAIISDASYLRVKNFSVSYELKNKMLSKIRVTQVKLFLQAQNLFTYSKYQGLDPENQNLSNTIPPLRIFIIGTDINF
ncbi:SusC/RagA family TonB-linked outer membrane protein [Chitinophaga filiformis]|uniref:SusC/RagA family TonB-linked outer membrane protein n=1 Tax=Chitinophaga filiformis TaxID=104663 RepID=A0ABY4HYQ5_CHIFI|nr:SusC/RagA family TonB-linked outer membrane protein [Chitinophaga filiformis]UPK68063.1 SusC/RagA family TonB-linked outer membrane protein [Chitinophaga filiformis]